MKCSFNLIHAGFIINLVLTLMVPTLLFGSAGLFILFIVPINMLISVFAIIKNMKLRYSNLGPILAIIAESIIFVGWFFEKYSSTLLWDTRVGLVLLLFGSSWLFNLTSAIAYFRLYHKMKKL